MIRVRYFQGPLHVLQTCLLHTSYNSTLTLTHEQGVTMSHKWRRRVASTEGGRIKWGGWMGDEGVWGSRSGGRGPTWKHIVAYFECHRTLLFVPICWWFECFMSHLGARPRSGGQLPPCPNSNPNYSMEQWDVVTSVMAHVTIHIFIIMW